MEELITLVKFIANNALGSNALINPQEDATLESKLFKLLQNNEVKTDKEASLVLYGTAELSSSFRMLKSRFQKKLFNHLHLVRFDSDLSINFNRAEHKCLTLLTEAHVLWMASENKLAVKVLLKAIKIADEHGITTMKVKALEQLRKIHIDASNSLGFEETEWLLQEAYQLERDEREAESLYSIIIISVKGATVIKSQILDEFPPIIEKFESLWLKSNSSKIFYYLHKISILYLEQLGKYDEIVIAIGRAENLLEQKRIKLCWYDSHYYRYIKVYAFLKTKKYKEGLALAALAQKLLQDGSRNWFASLENYFLLSIHDKDYVLASSLLKEVFSNLSFNNLPNSSKERWSIYEMFSKLIATINEDAEEEVDFKSGTSLSILSKDKIGFNLSILILNVFEDVLLSKADNFFSNRKGYANMLRNILKE
ncbi:hypothetical protein GCM10028895_04440 [Pontibacter rugosus]